VSEYLLAAVVVVPSLVLAAIACVVVLDCLYPPELALPVRLLVVHTEPECEPVVEMGERLDVAALMDSLYEPAPTVYRAVAA
jgi:hypothetical protein